MSYGIEVRNASGVAAMNGLKSGAVFLERYTTTANTAAQRNYSQATGLTIFVFGPRMVMSNNTFVQPFTISYPSGVPRVDFASVTGSSTYWVFAQ
jgi:hypothetical protein